MLELAYTAGFIVGPVSAVFTAPVCLIFIGMMTWPDRRWAELILGATFTTAVLTAWVAYWNLWNKIFVYVDDDRKVPAALHSWSVAAILTTVLGVPALCGLLVWSVLRSRRPRQRTQSATAL